MIKYIFNNFKLNKVNEDNGRVTLCCFSPPIMIATFIIEILLAIYSFIKSLKAKSDFNIVLTLIFLAIFQLSEYQICGGFNPLFWSRLGLFSITFLPVLGFYLITKISKKSNFLKFGFILAIAFVVFFVLVPHTVEGAICGGNYIIFDIKSGVNSLYGYYYFGFLILGIWESIKGIKSDNSKKKIKEAFKWFIIGYLSFILPLTLVYIFIPITRVAIASIMCGFAVIFAFILAFKIAPIYYECVKVEQKNFKEKK